MAQIYYDDDANLELLKGKTITVLGFGSQGHAHALNLRDSGCNVIVGLRSDSKSIKACREQGLTVKEVPEAVKEADIVMVVLPDEKQGDIYNSQIRDNLDPGNLLMFAHGFAIHFSQIIPPKDVDVAMIAPKSPGHIVRREYQDGRGVPGLVAVHQDATGKARDLALAYGKGLGLTKAGVFATTFKEETETDLFGEQAVLCGGITSLIQAGYETLIEAGYQPEMAYFECLNEVKLIVDLIYEGGFTLMRHSVSNTAEYGDYITQEKIIDQGAKDRMRQILKDIQTGKFARDWILENKAGAPGFKAMRRMAREHQVETVGEKLRAMMPWLEKKIEIDS